MLPGTGSGTGSGTTGRPPGAAPGLDGEDAMRTTIADVAAAAGVSKTTVSRVINAKSDVDAATASRVNQVIEQLGYVPSTRAVGLARGRTGAVGMLVPSLSWPWVAEVVQGVSDAL